MPSYGWMFRQLIMAQIQQYKEFRKIGRPILFDDERMVIFLQVYAATGRMKHAAIAADVGETTVKDHRKKDPEFDLACKEALAEYRDRVQEQAYKLAVEGWEEPIFGGKFKDQQVGVKMNYATNILAMELKRVNPEYRENHNVNVNVNAGVLLVPTGMSVEDWEKQHAEELPEGELLNPPTFTKGLPPAAEGGKNEGESNA